MQPEDLSLVGRRVLMAAFLSMHTLALWGVEQHGQILSHGRPVPGATVIITNGVKTFATNSDELGRYAYQDLTDGVWTLRVEMVGFAKLEQVLTIGSNNVSSKWELVMLPLDQALFQANVRATSGVVPSTPPTPPEKGAQASSAKEQSTSIVSPGIANDEGLLVNGSVNNAATSAFSLGPAFGNGHSGSKSLYNGGLGFVFGNAIFDARPYSLTGFDTPKSSYNQMRAIVTLGGPLNIPYLLPKGPNFSVIYQWTRNSEAQTQTGLMPTLAQRTEVMAATNPVAQALLNLYPVPNIAGNSSYNYQIPILNNTHVDFLSTRLDRTVLKNQLSGGFIFLSSRANTTNLFGFSDTSDTLGVDAHANWTRTFSRNWVASASYHLSRSRDREAPFFQNRVNVSGDAGMTGNDQDPTNWGPPTLTFSSGIASLTDGQSAYNRDETNQLVGSLIWYRGTHNLSVGLDFRRLEFNYFSQSNPRGSFTFTGDAFGSDFADFLHGVPDTAQITYGNPDKYLRQSVTNLYVNDDWRAQPDLTFNLGVRWEYASPANEVENRLANLDILPGFTAAAPVLANQPTGLLTGQHYPTSLLRPDKERIEPRLGVAWRPIPASSLVVRAGYGFYADTSVYSLMALQLALQSPFATNISADNATCAQSLRTGPNACSTSASNTFAVDPNFRVGYAQVWQVTAQRDLPAALQLTTTYLGIKGLNGVQASLPNTNPLGSEAACPSCPTGFVYRQSTGTSSREAGTVMLRRRLRSGLTASLQYTYSKSLDDDSVLGGQGPLAVGATSAAVTSMTIAQDWRDLHAERSLSTFDQRHLLNAAFQYNTGMGLGGETLLGGWIGRLYKEWAVQGTIAAGSGLPETPVYLAPVTGTGFAGSIRPDRTATSTKSSFDGRYLNPNAYTAPQPGAWGDAGRNSIEGPDQLTFNSSLARTFRPTSRYYLDFHVDATNLLNHAVLAAYNTTVSPTVANPLFGLPTAVNPMRSLETTIRLRF